MTTKPGFLARLLAGALLVAATAGAHAETCTDSPRTWTLTASNSCGMGEGNADEAGIKGLFPTTDWTRLGDITAASGADHSAYLDIVLTDGAFGTGGFAKGTWTLTAGFWQTYGEAVISMHVGGGPTRPYDYAAFLVVPKTFSGEWSYLQGPGGTGGGFSNLMLWGRGPAACAPGAADCSPPQPCTGAACADVPLPGTLALLGVGAAGLGWHRRRRARAA